MSTWVAPSPCSATNANLILLGKAQQSDLLSDLTEQLVIPQSVVREIKGDPERDPARAWIATAGQSWVLPDLDQDPLLAGWDLGAGETAVLTWAAHDGGFEAVLDDRAARKCARVHQIPCRGTLGVVLAARNHNLSPTARPVCEELIRAGLLID